MRNITSPEFWDEFEKRQLSPVDAVPTHLPSLNRICRDDGGGVGLARGWFVTVGANPGFGKSAFALNLAAKAAGLGEAVGYISLEMSAEQLAGRFYAIRTMTPIQHLERGGFDANVWAEITGKCGLLPPVFVPDQILRDWSDVALFVRECFEEGCKWFVLDYLQLVQLGNEEQITQAITEITTDLRAWAVDAPATVVVLSQFNRTTSSNYDNKPRAQGLWGGMILEASSDLVLLLDHSRYLRKGSLANTWLIVDKNRHGPVGEVPVQWDYTTLTMFEGAPMNDEKWTK